MDLSFSPDELEFRDEVREFLNANLSAEDRRIAALATTNMIEKPATERWHSVLLDKGWVAPHWPKKYGGTGWTQAQRFIYEAEYALAGAPRVMLAELMILGPAIMKFGTEAQKQHYLPKILTGEDYWCQGFSEPGAGSDLASLRTRAVRDGDHYIVNGTKMWTTHAQFANRMFALVRTSDNVKPQRGISFLLIDMDTPGIEVRPIISIGGDHETNQVFLDDVRVPISNLVGSENDGWSVAKYLLEFERGADARGPKLRRQLAKLKIAMKDCSNLNSGERYHFTRRFSELEIDIDSVELIELQAQSNLQNGENPGSASSILKIRTAELFQSLTKLAVELLGDRAMIWNVERPLHDIEDPFPLTDSELAVVPTYLNGRVQSIYGGSTEIQKEILAKVMLGL